MLHIILYSYPKYNKTLFFWEILKKKIYLLLNIAFILSWLKKVLSSFFCYKSLICLKRETRKTGKMPLFLCLSTFILVYLLPSAQRYETCTSSAYLRDAIPLQCWRHKESCSHKPVVRLAWIHKTAQSSMMTHYSQMKSIYP